MRQFRAVVFLSAFAVNGSEGVLSARWRMSLALALIVRGVTIDSGCLEGRLSVTNQVLRDEFEAWFHRHHVLSIPLGVWVVQGGA